MKLKYFGSFLLALLLCSCGGKAVRVPSTSSEGVVEIETAENDEITEVKSKQDSKVEKLRMHGLRSQGMNYYLRGDYAKAISHLEAAQILEPRAEESWSRFILFYCYLAVGDYHNARELSESLVNDFPYDSSVYLQAGLVQLCLGVAESAVGYFQKALDFEAHATRTHFYLGLAYQRLKQIDQRDKAFDEAEKEYLQILNGNPKDFSSNYELASLYLFTGKHLDKVPFLIQSCKENLSHGQDDDLSQEKRIYAHYYVPLLEAILWYHNGDAKRSLKLLVDSLSYAPSGIHADLAEVYHYIGLSFMKLGDNENAKSFLDRAINLDPNGIYAPESENAKRLIASREGTPQ